MSQYKIAVLPLDGVGKELIPMGVKVMQKAQEVISGFNLDFQYYEAGVEYAQRTGNPYEPNFKENLEAADAMFCGSAGHYDLEMSKTEYPGYKIGFGTARVLRKGMGNTIGLRPLKLIRGMECRVKNIEEIDVYLVRQMSEGAYNYPGYQIGNDAAYDTLVVTRPTTEVFADYCFKLAQNRNGRRLDGKKMVTLGNKQSVLVILDFYRKIFIETSQRYPDVELQFTQIDALAEHLIKEPDRFDVIACENMCGDIIGDIGSLLIGGMGVTPTADVGGITPHFRPNHGTFPRANGKGFANPIAVILTARLLLETLGNDNGDNLLLKSADLILKAIEENLLSGGPRTIDMGGSAGNAEVTEAICKMMEKVSLH